MQNVADVAAYPQSSSKRERHRSSTVGRQESTRAFFALVSGFQNGVSVFANTLRRSAPQRRKWNRNTQGKYNGLCV